MTQEVTPTAVRHNTYTFDPGVLIRLGAIGAVMGALGWLLYLGITTYFVVPVFCSNVETFAVCRSGGAIAWIAGHVIAAAAALALMIRFAVYRPLLVIIGVFASLWAAHTWLGGMAWYAGMLWQIVLFALGTMLFGWIARIRNFWVALVVAVLLVVAARIVLMNA